MEKAAALCPDLIILDISLGDMTGLEVFRRARAAGRAAKVIFLTVHEDVDFVNAAFDIGASGYVVKSRIAEDLTRAINVVYNGGRFISVISPSPLKPISRFFEAFYAKAALFLIAAASIGH